MWPFRRRADAAPEPSTPAAAGGAAVQREPANGWAVVGMNVQRAIGPMPLTYLSTGVSEIMPTHHDPSVSGSMGHAVSADAPSGVVRGLATTVSAEHDSWDAPASMSLRQPRLAEEPEAPEPPARWLPVSQPAAEAADESPGSSSDDTPSPVTASSPEPPRLLHATPAPSASRSSVQRAAAPGATTSPSASASTSHAPATSPSAGAADGSDRSSLLRDLPAGAVVPDQPLTLADVEARYTSAGETTSPGPDLAPPIQPRRVQRRATGEATTPPIAVNRSIAPSATPAAAEPTVSRVADGAAAGGEEHFPGDGHDHGDGDAGEGGAVQRMALASPSPSPSPATHSPSSSASAATPSADGPSQAATGDDAPAAAAESDAPLVGEQPLAPTAAPASSDGGPTVSREASAPDMAGGGAADALGPLAALAGGGMPGGGGGGGLDGGGAGGAGGAGDGAPPMPLQMEAVQRAPLAAAPAAHAPASHHSPVAPTIGAGGDASDAFTASAEPTSESPDEPAHGEEAEAAPHAGSSAPALALAHGSPSVGTASDPAVPTLGVTAVGPDTGPGVGTTPSAGQAAEENAGAPAPLTVARLASMPAVQRSAAPIGQRAVAIQARATTPLVSVSREAQPPSVPPAVQRMVEQRTGADLSDVVVHRQTGDQARSMSAHAFTHNGEVHIPAHHGPLDSGPGQSLLAHELTHVAQQRQLGDSRPAESTPQGQALEAQAQHSELAIAGAAPTGVPTVSRLAEGSVQRLPARRANFTLASHRVSANAAAPTTEDEKQPEEQAPQPPEPPPPPMALASPPAPSPAPAGEDEKQGAQPAAPPQPQPAPQPGGGAGEDEKQSQPENNIVGATASPAPAGQPGGDAAAAGGAAAGGAGGGDQLDELARKLYDKIRWRMRAELRMDLERGGRGAGINH